MIKIISNILANPDLSAKLAVATRSAIGLLFFVLLFVLFYNKFFWKELEARRLFWFSTISLTIIVLAKFIIGLLYKGYIPELTLFYAIPSPKATSWSWSTLAVTTFLVFLYFRKKIERLSTAKFLLSLFIIFFVFSVSIAAIREGTASLADPFTRTYWEYSGNIPLIRTVKDFLHNYISLKPQLARHSITHPPGYSLVLYLFYKLFSVSFLGLSLLIVLTTGFVLWPLLFLWKNFLSEIEARRALEIFIFIPSVVMMTATSLEGFFMLAVWTAIACCFIGWRKNAWLAVLGGTAAAVSLFSNFLFLLLGPFFIFLSWYALKGATSPERYRILLRIVLSLLSFILFFVIVRGWSQYSIIDNFFTARLANQGEVNSNFTSLPVYLMYLAMNIVNFLIYLGLPLVFIFWRGLPDTFKNSNVLFKSGVWILISFLAIGVFQGNVERLWLFILPFFAVFANKLFKEESQFLFNAYLSLVFLQIVVIQVLFYTFF